MFAWSLIACVLVSATVTAEPSPPVIYRIFLQHGETVVSYGDYVQVGDRVVFSLPVGDLVQGNTQLVSMPARVVDWTATGRYADAARAANYAATRGEADFAHLSAQVAGVLNQIAFSGDPDHQRSLARDARERLVEWTAAHHGYRAHDIYQVVALLDEAIPDMRTTDGDDGLSLSLVATTMRPTRTSLLPHPRLTEIIVQAVAAARLTPVPAERLSVLQAVAGLLDDSSSELPGEWRQRRLAAVNRELQAELGVRREYVDLQRTALSQATTYARQADVRGVESVLDEMLARDAVLGRRRPDLMSALVDAVGSRLADARSLRLARDRWLFRVEVFRQYGHDVDDALTEFTRAQEMLDDIRLLAGPSPNSLGGLDARLARAAATLDGTVPPLEVRRVHELYRRAFMLAVGAVGGRHQAVQSGDLEAAWVAASAAAGSLMLFERATEELDRTLIPPEPN